MAGRSAEEGIARIELRRRLIAELRANRGSGGMGGKLQATLEALHEVADYDRERHETAFVSEPSNLWRRPYIR